MRRLPRPFLLAALAIALWTAFVIAAARVEGLGPVTVAVAVLVPGLLMGLVAWLVRAMDDLREDTAEIADLIDALQDAQAAPAAAPAPASANPRIEAALARLAERQQLTDRALHALLEGRRDDRSVLVEVAQNTARALPQRPAAAQAPMVESDQAPLPLDAGAPDRRPRPETPDILRALNFPTDADDTAGFRAMRRATADHVIAQILRAAEDVLNLLAQDGIYTDDLEPSPTDPALWRRFADGARGAEMAPLAGITDASALALTRARMRGDEVMRDAALHFMRRFDLMLRDRIEGLTDGEVARLVDTRSGRAFMLVAAVSGAFD